MYPLVSIIIIENSLVRLINERNLKIVPFDNLVGYAVVFLSPAFIFHSAYLTGSQDLQLLIIMAMLVLFVRRGITLMILSCIEVLMHELFIFLLPVLFW